MLMLLFSRWVTSDSITPWTAAPQAPLSSIISWSLLKFMSIELVMLSNHLILCCSLLLLLQSFLASESFTVGWLFASGGQSIGALAIALPMNIQDWFPSGLTDLISLQSRELSRVFCSTTIWKHQFFGAQPSLWSNSHICAWLLDHSFDYMDLYWQSDVSVFNTLSKFVIAFLPRSKHLLIWWLQPLSTVILEFKMLKSVAAFTFYPSICHEVMEPDDMIFVFWMLSFKPAFSLSFSPSSRGFLVLLHFLHTLGCWYFSWQSWFLLVIYPAWHFA